MVIETLRSDYASKKAPIYEDTSSISSGYISDASETWTNESINESICNSRPSSASSSSIVRTPGEVSPFLPVRRPNVKETAQRTESWVGEQSSEPEQQTSTVPATQRQHPRRTAPSVQPNDGRARLQPCSLIRQDQRSECFVALLVAFTAGLVAAIWPLSACPPRVDPRFYGGGVLPLKTFIQETLRRSKTSYSTLQVALYYLILLKDHLPKRDLTQEQPALDDCRAMQCGRRMFLSALILASKYLQDHNYSTRAWSKISGLRSIEINQNEMRYLQAINWKLHVPQETFEKWQRVVVTLSAPHRKDDPHCNSLAEVIGWKRLLSQLTPNLTLHLFDLTGYPSPPVSPPADDYASSDREEPKPIESHVNLLAEPVSAEPTPRLNNASQPILPPVPQLHNLPTPQATPFSRFAATPTVAILQPSPRCPASRAAMASLGKVCMARATLDRCPPPPARSADQIYALPCQVEVSRSSPLSKFASTSMSSPESMVSDHSSWTRSRCPSISSVASSGYESLQSSCHGKVNPSDTSGAASMVTTYPKDARDDVLATTKTPRKTGVDWQSSTSSNYQVHKNETRFHRDIMYPAAIPDNSIPSAPATPVETHMASFCDIQAAAALCNLRPNLSRYSTAVPISMTPRITPKPLQRCKIDVGPAKSHKRSHSKIHDPLQEQVRRNLMSPEDTSNMVIPDDYSMQSYNSTITHLDKACQSPYKGWATRRTPVPVQGITHSKRWCAIEKQNTAAADATRMLRANLRELCR